MTGVVLLVRRLVLATLVVACTAALWPIVWGYNVRTGMGFPWAPILMGALILGLVKQVGEVEGVWFRIPPRLPKVAFSLYLLVASVSLAAVLSVVAELLSSLKPSLGYLSQLPLVGLIIFVLADALIHGFAEELAFRGLLQPAFVQYVGRALAVLITSMLYVAAHLPGVTDYLALPHLALLSVFLGSIAMITGSFVLSALLHSGYNLAAYALATPALLALSGFDLTSQPLLAWLAIGLASAVCYASSAKLCRYWSNGASVER